MKRSRMGNWMIVNCSRGGSLNYLGSKNSFCSNKMMNLNCLKNSWRTHWKKHLNKRSMNDTPYNRSCYMMSYKIWSFVLSLSLRNSI